MDRLSAPVIICIVLVALAAGGFVMNKFFYGSAVSLDDQRVVLADIGDFPRFIEDVGDDGSSTDEIITMRDDPSGNCLCLRVRLLVKHIYEKKGTHTGQIIIKNDDFSLTTGSQSYKAVLLAGGNEINAGELVIQSLALRRAADGSIESSMAGNPDGSDKASLGDLVRNVKGAHRAASFGGGGHTRGIFDWVPGPLEERSRVIQPPSLRGYVWRAQLSQNIQDAWKSAEINCLFPLPATDSNLKLVVFGDMQTAIPVSIY
jgi:hypothetical protein